MSFIEITSVSSISLRDVNTINSYKIEQNESFIHPWIQIKPALKSLLSECAHHGELINHGKLKVLLLNSHLIL